MMPNQSKDVELLENQPQEAAKGVEPLFIPEPMSSPYNHVKIL
jgi:hypothetical protein